jgi:hypothetical protein
MIDDTMALSLIAGEGVVLRIGPVIAVIERGESANPDDIGALLQLCREAGAGDDPAPGAGLARKAARMLLDMDPDTFPDFAIVAPAGDELIVLLHGDMELTATREGEAMHHSGREASTWSERRLGEPVDELLVHPSSGPSQPDLWTDLRSGVAHGCGFRLRRVGAAAAPAAPAAAPAVEPAVEEDPTLMRPEPAEQVPPAPEPLPEPAGDFEVVSLVGPSATTTSEQRAPLPVESPAAEAVHEGPSPVLVKGIRCARDHHNNPLALYCSRCGIKMVHRTHVLVDGERPPLGVLTFDDGSTYPVNMDLVIGREPAVDERVAAQTARAVQIRDEQRSVSRAHLAIVLDEWDVYAVDLESANGTFARSSSNDEWRRLGPGERFELRTGASIRLGGREIVFDQHHVQ